MPRRYKKYKARSGREVFCKLDKDSVRSADNLPKRPFIRQGADHSHIPSKNADGHIGMEGSETIMAKVMAEPNPKPA